MAKEQKPETQYTYKATGHVVIDEPGGGHIYGDTDENRKAELRTTVTLTEGQAKRYGNLLVKGDPVKADNKQLTDADMSTK